MARRALRKLDPDIDLGRWFHTWDEVTVPWSANSWFERDAPLEVELGSGKGLFLASASMERPQHNFLGLEMARKYALHAASRLARSDAANAVVLHGDGLRFFRELAGNDSLAAIHVYFPDPWWKARHKKRRVLNEAFLRDAQRTLESGGSLHFWTDVQEYFETSLELIAATTHLAGPFDVPEQSPRHELDYRTHFERRTRLYGEPVYRAEFRKLST